ncbi:hypothetical protein GOBAR_DD13579 [Gossypium barbadense]|nr:hypothetical protein GOBAR_DD13579 [Gossypium barbadense]
MPLWIRIYNIPMEQMDRQVAIDVGKAIGEVVAIDWRDRDQGWTDHIRIRVRIDVLKPLRRVVHFVGSKGSKTICTIKYERLPAFCYICGLIGHTTQKCNRKEEHLINLSEEIKDAKERSGEENNITLLKEKEKAKAGEEESESCSPMEKRPTKLAHNGGGKMRCKRKRVKGSNGENNEESPARLVHWFLGHAYPNLRNRSWDILRTVRRSIREDWVVGGDFNAIISDAEKEGGCRKFRVTMEEFHDVMKELSLVDIKIDKGNNMVKERLDRFLISANAIDSLPFLAAKVVRKSNSDHLLGPWRHSQYRKMKKQIWELVARIDKLIDGPNSESNANIFKFARFKLGHLYAKEECDWAQRSSIRWLKEGDRNTLKKNNIERLKDSNGIWTHDKNGICKVAWEYFHCLFKSDTTPYGEPNLSYIHQCVTEEINTMLARAFTDGEILDAFSQMDPCKVPGINGLSGCLFIENWEVVGEESQLLAFSDIDE